jgi:hypothetical protein
MVTRYASYSTQQACHREGSRFSWPRDRYDSDHYDGGCSGFDSEGNIGGRMNIRDQILEDFGEEAETMLFADGFDDAILGVGNTFGGKLCAIYDTDLVLKSCMKDGMEYDEALEYFDFNIAGSYVGEQTPIFIHKIERQAK